MRRVIKALAWRMLLAEYSEGMIHGIEAGQNLAKFRIRKKFNELEAKADSVPNLYTLTEILEVINAK